MYAVLSNDALETYAAQVLARPSNFGTTDPEAFTTHGAVYSRHRDSDYVQRANFDVFLRSVRDAYPDDVYVMACSHWAVGWIDHLMVRVHSPLGGYTVAFREACDLVQSLEDYPVLDDELASEYEDAEDHPGNGECYSERCREDGRCVHTGRFVRH